jgi:UDP-3-O-[3-hydroxymyristoyl] glucosamine N-acyltransferase
MTPLAPHKTAALNMTVAEIAKMLGGKVEGDAGLNIECPAKLQDAGPNDISFYHNPKYVGLAEATEAGCLLLPLASAGLPSRAKSRIIVEDPYLAFSRILIHLVEREPKGTPGIDPKASVHPEAKLGADVAVGAFTVIEKGAAIGDGVRVGPQCYVGPRAKIGRGCLLHPQVVIRQDCVVGERVIIHPGTVIGGDGFGFTTDRKTGRHSKIPQLGNVIIGDDCEIGSNVTIDRAMVGSTVVGPGTMIDNLVMLAHGVKVGRDCVLVSQVGIAGSTALGDRVVLGGQVGLVGHIKLGDGVQVGAQSGIMTDVPKGTIMFGYPARPHRESFKLQALYGRLPEMYAALKAIQKKLGIETKTEVKSES